MPEPELDFWALLRELREHEIEFIVIGGVAAVLQGAPVTTFDLDIVHSRRSENVKRLHSALESLQAYYREHADRRPGPDLEKLAGPGHHLFMTRKGALDVLGEVSGAADFERLLTESDSLELEPGLQIRILTLRALIHLKEQLGREKDLATLAILRRTLEDIG